MLSRLYIENYALVDKIEIDFGPGLTVLTGETGAGKSVIIGGLILALGGRADRDLIRHGAQKTVAALSLELPPSSTLKRRLAEISDNPAIIAQKCLHLSREVNAGGSSRALLDDQPIAVGKIRDMAALLVDLHSQQGQRSLMDVEQHRFFLDNFAGLTADVDRLGSLYNEYISLKRQLYETEHNAAAMKEKLELINFQVDELTKARIHPGEESELDNERLRLESVRTLMETGQAIVTSVSDSDESIVTVLSRLEKMLRKSASIDNRLADDAALLTESVINLNELCRNLQSYLSTLEDNPARLDDINERLSELYRLKKKYGTDEAGLLVRLEELKQQSLGSADIESLIKQLRQKTREAASAYLELAVEISEKRREAARSLEKKVEKQLRDLAIDKAAFAVDFRTEYDPDGMEVNGEPIAIRPSGLETIEFLISTNPNEPLKPLVKIASGGEVSRIMLALLSVIAGKYRLPVIIFDEIDTGIGGVTAVKVGQKLKELSRRHQVITISHLPAVASQADHHLAVEKSLKDGRNIITVKEVTGPALKRELARMEGVAP